MKFIQYIEGEFGVLTQEIEETADKAWEFLRPLLTIAENELLVDLRGLAEQAVESVVKDAGALIGGKAFADIVPLVLVQAQTLALAAEKDLEVIGQNLVLAVLAAMTQTADPTADPTAEGGTTGNVVE